LNAWKKEGCASLESGVKACRYDYSVDGKGVEAISFVPAGDGHFPGVLMVPGYDRTARDLAPLGLKLARKDLLPLRCPSPVLENQKALPTMLVPKHWRS
jgi:hypothetical protein